MSRRLVLSEVIAQLAWLGLSASTLELIEQAVAAHNVHAAWVDYRNLLESLTGIDLDWLELPAPKAVRVYGLAVLAQVRSNPKVGDKDGACRAVMRALETSGPDACALVTPKGLELMESAFVQNLQLVLQAPRHKDCDYEAARRATAQKAVAVLTKVLHAKIDATFSEVTQRLATHQNIPTPSLGGHRVVCLADFLEHLSRRCGSPFFPAFITTLDLEVVDAVLGGNAE